MAKSMYVNYKDCLRIHIRNLDGAFFCRNEHTDEIILLIAHDGLEAQITFTENEADYLVWGLATACGYDAKEPRQPETITVDRGMRDDGTYPESCEIILNFRNNNGRKGVGFFTVFEPSKKDAGNLLKWLAPRANWKLAA